MLINAIHISKRILFILLVSSITLAQADDIKRLDNPIQLITEEVRPPNLCIKLNITMNSLMDSFNSITDITSAKAAIPELTLSTNMLGELSKLMDQIPAVGIGQVSLVVTKRTPERQAVIKKLNSIPGVSEIIEPVVTNLAKKEAIYVNLIKEHSNN